MIEFILGVFIMLMGVGLLALVYAMTFLIVKEVLND